MIATHILFPDSKTPRLEQYKLAWKMLLNPNSEEEDRCHAKCWLTYRCADGEIAYTDYLDKIKPVSPNFSNMVNHRHARWVVSIAMSDIFASLSNGRSDEGWIQIAEHTWRYCFDKAISIQPPAVTSFVRLGVILAYKAFLSGEENLSASIIKNTWGRYKKACQVWHWENMTYRPMEAIEDMKALQMLQFIGVALGLVRKSDAEWCTPAKMLAPEGARYDSFIRGVARLSQLATDKSRIIFPDPNKTEREIVADYAGDGLFVELGVAAGAFAERVLDRNRSMRYVGIDKWDDHHNVTEMEKAATKLSRFGGRAELKRASFGDAVEGVKDESCDVIYVDGYAHTGQDDGKTLRDWWLKVKSGGVFSGHDYDDKWPKTIAAVDAFAESIGATVEVIKDEPYSSWIIRKPAKPHP